MKVLPWATLVLVATAATTTVVFAGCGSDGEATIGSDDGGDEASQQGDGSNVDGSVPSDSGFIDAILDGGRDPDAAVCKATGATCAKSTECCTTNCSTTTGKCEVPTGLCKLPGLACTTGNECCTFSCIGGTCSNKLCVADNLACAADNECCGGKCAPDGLGGGKCTPLNGGGPATGGNPCVANNDCASKLCQNGICVGSSFCGQSGDVCSTSAQCCGGKCTIAPGNTLGVCGTVSAPGATNCEAAGTVCPLSMPPAVCGGSCCSRACAPFGPTGVSVCQPESGCRVTGSICLTNTDCCGSAGLPDGADAKVTCSKAAGSLVGRCDNGNKCSPAGAICRLATVSCNATDRCCAGTVQQKPFVCQQDALGIPRCMVGGDYNCAVSGPPPAGTVCASSADCCGNPCVPNAGGVGFVCGTHTQCIPSGGTCTSNADCCPGLPCAIAPGSSKGVCGGTVLTDGGVSNDGGAPVTQDGGVCALYGQQCAMNSDCCSSVPCTNNTCRFP